MLGVKLPLGAFETKIVAVTLSVPVSRGSYEKIVDCKQSMEGFMVLKPPASFKYVLSLYADLSIHPEPVLPLTRSASWCTLRSRYRHVEFGLYSCGNAYRRTALQWGERGENYMKY